MNTQQEVISAIAQHLGLSPQDIDRQASLEEDLSLGQLELNDLISHLCKTFDMVLNPEDLIDVKTVDDLIVLIEDNSI